MADAKLSTFKNFTKFLLKGSPEEDDIDQALHLKLNEGVLGGLLKDSPDWKNIQEIIKEAVKSLSEVAVLQNQSLNLMRNEIKEMKKNSPPREALEGKLDRKEFLSALSKLTNTIDRKVERDDLSRELEENIKRVDLEELRRNSELRMSEIEAQYCRREELEDTLNEFASVHKKLNTLQSLTNAKMDRTLVIQQMGDLDRKVQTFERQINALEDSLRSVRVSIDERYTREEVNMLVESRAQEVSL